MPTSCDAIASLKPLQVAGGEQTLFIVTTDGKVCTVATGLQKMIGCVVVQNFGQSHYDFSVICIEKMWIKVINIHSIILYIWYVCAAGMCICI